MKYLTLAMLVTFPVFGGINVTKLPSTYVTKSHSKHKPAKSKHKFLWTKDRKTIKKTLSRMEMSLLDIERVLDMVEMSYLHDDDLVMACRVMIAEIQKTRSSIGLYQELYKRPGRYHELIEEEPIPEDGSLEEITQQDEEVPA